MKQILNFKLHSNQPTPSSKRHVSSLVNTDSQDNTPDMMIDNISLKLRQEKLDSVPLRWMYMGFKLHHLQQLTSASCSLDQFNWVQFHLSWFLQKRWSLCFVTTHGVHHKIQERHVKNTKHSFPICPKQNKSTQVNLLLT